MRRWKHWEKEIHREIQEKSVLLYPLVSFVYY